MRLCAIGHIAGNLRHHIRFTSSNRHRAARRPCPPSADFVAKVKNRTTQKISQKSIFELLRCWVASAAPGIFVRHPKKIFATIPALLTVGRCPLSRVTRKTFALTEFFLV
jgi:hypothetical protein